MLMLLPTVTMGEPTDDEPFCPGPVYRRTCIKVWKRQKNNYNYNGIYLLIPCVYGRFSHVITSIYYIQYSKNI